MTTGLKQLNKKVYDWLDMTTKSTPFVLPPYVTAPSSLKRFKEFEVCTLEGRGAFRQGPGCMHDRPFFRMFWFRWMASDFCHFHFYFTTRDMMPASCPLWISPLTSPTVSRPHTFVGGFVDVVRL